MDIEIKVFESQYKDDFVRLTKLWLNEYFWIEPSDEDLFADPHTAYVKTGGEILIAVDKEKEFVAGVCALAFHPDESYWELSKLSVDPQYQRQGIAEKLMDAIIELAKKKGASKLYLDTNQVLEAAVRLYRRKGFEEIPLQNSHYQRTNLQMVKQF